MILMAGLSGHIASQCNVSPELFFGGKKTEEFLCV